MVRDRLALKLDESVELGAKAILFAMGVLIQTANWSPVTRCQIGDKMVEEATSEGYTHHPRTKAMVPEAV